jgi:hypothetical protein
VPGRRCSFCRAVLGRTTWPLVESVVSMSYRLTIKAFGQGQGWFLGYASRIIASKFHHASLSSGPKIMLHCG